MCHAGSRWLLNTGPFNLFHFHAESEVMSELSIRRAAQPQHTVTVTTRDLVSGRIRVAGLRVREHQRTNHRTGLAVLMPPITVIVAAGTVCAA